MNLFVNLSSYRPNTGASPFEEEEADLYHKYEKISPAEAGIDDITIIDGKLGLLLWFFDAFILAQCPDCCMELRILFRTTVYHLSG